MIRTIFKWSFRTLLGLIIIAASLYGGFHLWEYVTGKKYIEYLSENSETVSLDSNFDYEDLGADIEENQLILVGEIHGFHETAKFDIDLFKYLHEHHNVNHYIAEVDFVQASLLNEFLISGDRNLLRDALNNWVVVQGRDNKDYFDKYLELHQYYKQLPKSDKFKFIGIDRIQDSALINKYLINLYPTDSDSSDVAIESKSIDDLIEELNDIYRGSHDTLFVLSHLKSNMSYLENKQNREDVMFQNFNKIYKEYKLKGHKLYGFFGLYHVFQYRVNGNHPLASKIRQSDLGLEDKILSINMMMNDSYMVMPSSGLPEFMRDDGPYTRMPVSADNMLFMYIVGIKDFKRMTQEYQKSLIKMNGDNNPYSNSIRLNKVIQLLPVTDVFEMTDKGKPYVQYTVFIRNSDWAEPIK